MKKKIFGGIAVLAIVAAAAWNVNLGSKTNGMSNVMLANVEALAGENNGSGSHGCDTKMSYEYRQELCSSNTTTSLTIMNYTCISGSNQYCQNGSIVQGMDCNGYVNTNTVTTINC